MAALTTAAIVAAGSASVPARIFAENSAGAPSSTGTASSAATASPGGDTGLRTSTGGGVCQRALRSRFAIGLPPS